MFDKHEGFNKRHLDKIVNHFINKKNITKL